MERISLGRGQEQTKDSRGLARPQAPDRALDRGRQWAVIIGVNEYLDPTVPSLRDCVADVHPLVEKLVQRCGDDPERILLTADDQKAHLRPLKINLQGEVQKRLMHAEPVAYGPGLLRWPR